jgi:hypothetical protein
MLLLSRFHLNGLAVLVLALSPCIVNRAAAQPAAGQLADSGPQPWVVMKVKLVDATGQSDEIVADFPTADAARAHAARLQQAEKDPANWLYAYRARQSEPGTIAGRTFAGQIGPHRIVIRFASSGAFVVSGELQGSGRWTQDGSGLLLETAIAKYRGQIDGDRISGLRFRIDGAQPIIAWSVVLSTAAEAELVGRWVDQRREGDSTMTITLALRPDHTGAWMHDYDYLAASNGMVQSRLVQSEIRWRLEKEPDVPEPRDGILLEHARGDRPWSTKWIALSGAGLGGPWQKVGWSTSAGCEATPR